jgi:hypothetical protein
MSGFLLSAAVAPTPPCSLNALALSCSANFWFKPKILGKKEKGAGSLWCKLLLIFRRSMHRAMVSLLLCPRFQGRYAHQGAHISLVHDAHTRFAGTVDISVSQTSGSLSVSLATAGAHGDP